MGNYYMIGGDGKEYGPVTATQLRQWLAEGRANGQTQIRPAEGGAYTDLGSVSELNSASSAVAPASPLPAGEYFMQGGDGKDYGPVSAQQLRQWKAEGRANDQTLVRSVAGGGYVAFGTVPELSAFARPAGAAGLPMAQSLAQNATLSGGDDGAQVRRLASVLAAGGGWMKFFAVILFIAGGLMAISIVGLVVAWLPIWLGTVLMSAANRAENALALGSESELSAALEKCRFYFKLSVIGALAAIILLLLGFLLFVAMGMTMANLVSQQMPI